MLATSIALDATYDVDIVLTAGPVPSMPQFDLEHVNVRPEVGPIPWRRRLECIREIKGADLVIIEGSWNPMAPVIAGSCKLRGVPYVYVPHGSFNSVVSRAYPKKHVKKLAWWLLFERHIVSGAAATWFSTEYELHRSSRTFPWMPKSGRTVGFTTTDRGVPPRRSGVTQPHVVTASRIHSVKSLETLLLAIARNVTEYPEISLTIAGDGEEKYVTELKALSVNLDIADRVNWVGFLGPSEMADLFSMADIYASPGVESFGMAVVEALSSNVPVALSTEVAVSSIVQERGAGTVAAYGDQEAFDAALALGIEKALAGEFGDAPRRLYDEEFAPNVFASQFRSVFLGDVDEASS